MFKKRYYICTAAEDGLGINLYFMGRFTRKEADAAVTSLNEAWLFPFCVLTGRGIKKFARNIVRPTAEQSATLGRAADILKGMTVSSVRAGGVPKGVN